METPAITVQDLKRPIVAGKVGLINPGEFTHARFEGGDRLLVRAVGHTPSAHEPGRGAGDHS